MAEETGRTLGVEALRALAHPLRVQLYSALSSYGPATASSLAERFGESSGSTSYHLRQLERHGFVREDESRGNGRDRWWERVPGSIDIGNGASDEEPATREATLLVGDEFSRAEQDIWASYRRGHATLPLEWQKATDSSIANLQLTADELGRLSGEFHALVNRYRHLDAPGDRRRVNVQFRAFPVIDPMASNTGQTGEGDPS